jgi:hypothetical protein
MVVAALTAAFDDDHLAEEKTKNLLYYIAPCNSERSCFLSISRKNS